MGWTTRDMPRQDGRLAVVTGGNSGIGYETALALAEAGAQVIVAARDEAKGQAAAARIDHGAAWRPLDLANLASVRAFADDILATGQRLDLLILNAGVMAVPERRETADGFELQIGTNYLGHFALTARLWPLLAATQGARVVSLSSIAARRGRIDLTDLMATKHYRPWPVYSQSKLAMLVFARELAKRAHDTAVSSVAAHPGFARTNLLANGPGKDALRDWSLRLFGDLISQSGTAGALPVLRAATDPAVVSGDYIGSIGPFGLKGPPGPAAVPRAALDPVVAEGLWARSEDYTGLSFRP